MIRIRCKIPTSLFKKSMFFRNKDLKNVNIYSYITYHWHLTNFTHSYWIFMTESVTWNFSAGCVHSACFQKVFQHAVKLNFKQSIFVLLLYLTGGANEKFPKMENSSRMTNNTDFRCAVSNGSMEAYICIISEFAPMTIWFDRYMTIFWYCVGITGNSLTIKIWSTRVSRTNISALYLIVLAITDLFYLLLHVIQELKFAWGLATIDIEGWCQIYFVFYMFAMYMSPLLILGFTIERFLSIIHPFKSQRFSTTNRGPFEISGITVLALLLALPQIFCWDVIYGECQGPNSDFPRVWMWVSDSLVFVIFPVTSLVLNTLVMRAASKADKIRRSTVPLCRGLSTPDKNGHHSKAKSSPTTLTLLCVSFYRIITVIPVSILFALQGEFKYGNFELPLSEIAKDRVWRNHLSWYKAKKTVDEIGLSQYCCNIFIYLVTAHHFRREMKKLFYFVPFMRSDEFSDTFNTASMEMSFLKNKPKDDV